jgi:sulfatase maturation enzyme AslB (radical SAM superfamily)
MCTNFFGYRKEEGSAPYLMDKVLERVERRGEILKNNPTEIIHFTGGEPTIHPQFLEVIKKVRKRFPKNKIVIATNGRRFTYQNFTKSLFKINNIRLEIVLHGPNKKLHDGITRTPGSFEQTMKGLENIFKYKNQSHSVEIRHVLLKQNYKKLNQTYHLVKKFSDIERMVTIFPEYEGRAEKNIDLIGITYSEAVPFVEKATEKWKNEFRRFHLYHFPLCVINSDYWNYVVRSVPREEMIFKKECDQCIYKEYCLGIQPEYKKNIGGDEFKPIKKKKKDIKTREDDYHYPIYKK